ncbi:SCO family protein [Paracidovorax wautersii]|uniref:SCO family protein n=1 Tax=Paracidovorax wautersii TaxID=1177982 RepID=UPI0031D2A863
MFRPTINRIRLAALAGLALMAGTAAAQLAPWTGLRLVDHRQHAITAQSLRGKPVLLHFVFTGCTSTCPPQVHELVQMRAALPPAIRAQLQLVSVTVDPLGDTPQALAQFAARLGADQPGWHFVTGAPSQLLQFSERMAAFDLRRTPQPVPADHRTSLWLYDARGALVQRYGGWPVDRARLVAEITQIVQPQRVAAASPSQPSRPTQLPPGSPRP